MNPISAIPPLLVRRSLFLIFTISGFAGLIYESIWSHYLKLLLGHAAYAQTLVLVLFMGGMAIGSWLCARISMRIRHPLLAYAGVELLLGVFAFGFDPLFRKVSDWVLNSAAPLLAQPLPIEALKWGLSALLILPACVLLGATFPLISAGVVRLAPREAGNALGWLYFTNSLGAVAGVLTSGFVLVSWIGLPGTLLTAGLCNFGLAIVVYALGRRTAVAGSETGGGAPAASSQASGVTSSNGVRLLLVTAFLTGAASFFYEIGWIRMLSLVLGSATHSFELMLGAFILGLALGALWIRNRIDRVPAPLRLLAWVQVFMGAAALCTLVVYGWSFDWMAGIVRALAKTDTGFVWFNVLSQGICIALMLPVTFFAGMTLPLITAMVMRTAAGESAIGRVYAANTWGAIFGVVMAVHLVMPVMGLRNVVVMGAAIDISLGLYLFSRARVGFTRAGGTVLASVLILAAGIAIFVRLDASRMSSGVYRHGVAQRHGEVLLHRDGRTASIDVVRTPDGATLSITTNGKPDAALRPDRASEDDYVMILTGVLPLALRPEARSVAVIGMGSGRSTHVFLGAPGLETVDTIEIEPAMVEGARLFGPMVQRSFSDPRSHIYVEDAKTFFARHQKRYDLIMSEPSNPWVSGVASLFSLEFYRQIKRHLAPGGVFVQWLQLYEFDDALAASVMAALEQEFEDYAIYMPDNSNLLIAAVPKGSLPEPDGAVLRWPGLQALAASIGVNSREDLRVRRLATRASAASYVQAIGSPPNSDYFPFLDQRAARFRFMQSQARGLTSAHAVLHRLEPGAPIAYRQITSNRQIPFTVQAARAQRLADYLWWKHRPGATSAGPVETAVLEHATRLDAILARCEEVEVNAVWRPALAEAGQIYWPYIEPVDALRISKVLRGNSCIGGARRTVDRWLDFMDAVATRNWEAVASHGAVLVAAHQGRKLPLPAFLVRELLLAEYHRAGAAGVALRASLLGRELPDDPSIRFLTALGG